jgi:hypothetical protein
MADEQPSIVLSLTYHMRTLGIDLSKYMDPSGVLLTMPNGFRFRCRNKEATDAFHMALIISHKFGADSALGGSQHPGVSWRENSRPTSLHVIISKEYCELHTDSVSPVKGVDESGQCIYDYGMVLDHLVTDLKHWPLVVPSSERGLTIGIRF